ncbi:MAG: sensor histidine kinase [Patescibacteria group bacterium]
MLFQKLKEDAQKYGVSIWKLPDVLLLEMAAVNIFAMVATYWWAQSAMSDPREGVLLVAAEAVLILFIGNLIAESSRKVIDNYKLKEEFIDLISHQVKTPLTSIKWNIELLNEKKTKGQERYIQRLTNSAEKMSELVSDFIYLSRLSRSKKEIHLEKVDLKELIKEVVKENELFSRAKGIKIKTKFFSKDEFCVKADRKKLEIALDNLVNNATKYSYEKSEVKIEAWKEDGRVIVAVKDEGCGIKKENQKRIFEKFYRAENAVKATSDGTGVGLYVAKTLIEEMRGKIWFDSEEDKGTDFYVSFHLC